MKRLLLPLIVACLCLPLPLHAADKWTRVQSKNFTLVGSATEKEIREVAEGLEVFRTAFARFFKLKEGSSVATTVVVFRSDQAFKPFKPVYQGKPANVAGYFQAGPDMNFIALAADMQTPRAIYHEYVHRLMSDNMASLPPWFQEGFAECFSTLEIEGKDRKVRLGRAITEHVALLTDRNFMPIESLFSVQHGSPEYNEQEKQGLFYAESWALVHYMMFDSEQRRTQFNNFLARIGGGISAPQAFQEVFGTSVSEFQKTFEAYIRQRMAWNAFEIQTPAGLDRSKEMTARTMSEGEAEFYLGDLLLHTNRLPEAEPHLSNAIRLEPKLGGAYASMGRLHLKKGNRADALRFAKQAAELDPNNYLAHYYYASLIRSQTEPPSESDRATIRTELERTIALAPQFVEATEMLANENLLRNADMPQTVELLAKAIAVAPGRNFLVLQLASALSRTQQREEARPVLETLLARPGLEAPLRQNARSLLDFLDRAAAADSTRRTLERELARDVRPARVEESADISTPELRRSSSVEPDRTTPAPARTEALPPGTSKLRGVLTLLDCNNGVTLSLVVDGKVVKFHSSTPNEIKFTSFNPSVIRTIACGAVPGNGVPAAIVYRPKEAGGSIGDPVSVDFLNSGDGAADGGGQDPGLPAIPGTLVVRGLLTRVECTNGVSITLTVDGQILRFVAASAASVAFLNGPNSDGTVTCGTMPGTGLPVAVLYRPARSGDVAGEPVVVQFQRN